MYWSAGHWVWGTLMMLAFLIPVIVLLVMLLREPRGHGAGDERRRSARAILEERFARGEIGADELNERLRILEQGPG